MAKDTQTETTRVFQYIEKKMCWFSRCEALSSSTCWWLGAELGSLSTDTCDSTRMTTFKLLYKVIVPACLCKCGSCSRDGLPALSSIDLQEGSGGNLVLLGWFDVEASVGQSSRLWTRDGETRHREWFPLKKNEI